MRQSPYLIAQLGLINGNIDEYINGVTKAQDVTQDTEKVMDNWATQLKLARNSMFALNETAAEFLDNVGAPMLSAFNGAIKLIKSFSNNSGILGGTLGVLKDTIFSVVIAITTLRLGTLMNNFMGIGKGLKYMVDKFKTLRGVNGLGTLKEMFVVTKMLENGTKSWALNLASIGTVIGGVLVVLTAVVSAVQRFKRIQEEARIEEIKRKKELQDEIKLLDGVEKSLQVQLKVYKDISDIDLNKNWERSYDLISDTVEKTKELAELLSLGSKLSIINIPTMKEEQIIAQEIREEYSKLKKETEDRYRVENKEFAKLDSNFEKNKKKKQKKKKTYKETKKTI